MSAKLAYATTDYLLHAGGVPSTSTAFSVAGWVRFNAYNADGFYHAMMSMGVTSTRPYWFFPTFYTANAGGHTGLNGSVTHLDMTPLVSGSDTIDSSDGTGGTPTVIADNNWHHVCITVKNNGDGTTTIKSYLDAALCTVKTGTDAVGIMAQLTGLDTSIGAQNNGSWASGWDGKMSRWGWWDAELSQANVTALQTSLPSAVASATHEWLLDSDGDDTIGSFDFTAENDATWDADEPFTPSTPPSSGVMFPRSLSGGTV